VTTERGKRTGLARAVTLAGAIVLTLSGCASTGPQAAQPGHPGVAPVPGALPTARLATTEQQVIDRAGAASATGQPGATGRVVDPATPASEPTAAGPAIQPTGNTAGPATQPGCGAGSGFALSLASGYHGWDSPVQAAQQFSRQADPAGYGTPSTVWTAGAPDRSGVTLTAPQLSLHAVRLPNGRWAIDSGQRCG